MSSTAADSYQSRTVTVRSFDGVGITTNFYPATGLAPGQTAPTILQGPGFGNEASPGTGEWDEHAVNIVVGPGALRDHGYNVVTWNPRGFYDSTGEVQLDSPHYEGRDVSAIIDWVAQQPEAKLVKPGYPLVGMDGGSYGGGIQIVAASIDSRIKAIVPSITWNSLVNSLYPEQTFNNFVPPIFAIGAPNARYAPWFTDMMANGTATGVIPGDDLAQLQSTVPDVRNIKAATLLIQGTVDTLFPLQQTDDTARQLIADKVPTKVIWFCGGHGQCITGVNDGQLIRQRTLEWLDKYVKGQTRIDTGPQFEWVDQTGQAFSAPTYPAAQNAPIMASGGQGLLPLTTLGGSGPQPLAQAFASVSGARASNAVNLTVRFPNTTTEVVGAPVVTFTYSGSALSTGNRLYGQLVDDTSGLVLGNAVTPIPIVLDGQTHTITHRLNQVAQTVTPGQTLTLQICASATAFTPSEQPSGLVTITGLSVTLPTYKSTTSTS